MLSRGGCVVIAGCLLFWAGCQKQPASQAVQSDLPAWMTNDDAREAAAPEIRLASETPSAHLGLNLKPGDHFPLRKVVVQELTQHTQQETARQNYSRLELLLGVEVLEKQDDRIRMSVRYDRVKYQHHVAGEDLEFDSTHPGQQIPPAARAYRDMVGDGFSFWIGKDNQIVEVSGLSEFIARCLRNVPPQDRQDVVLGIEAGAGDSGLANFVDNTIGLLPFGRQTSPGDSWERQQQVPRPLPMHVRNVYTLKELGPQHAVIDVRGTITPSTTINHRDGEPQVRVTVNGGSTLGSCVIYRETGLPKESRIDRLVEMTVTMDNAAQFRQTKRMTTTIEAFPMASTAAQPTVKSIDRGAIQRVSGVQEAGAR
jgi:hypothetical protein